MAGLIVLDVAHDAAVASHRVADSLPRLQRDLADQVRRAASSVVLNLAEGAGRGGRDRGYHWRVAYASAGECFAALRLARDVGAARAGGVDFDRALSLLDRTRRMTWGLLRPWR